MANNPIKNLLRAAINEAAMASVNLPKFDFSTISDEHRATIVNRLADFKILRNMGHFDAEKRAEFETMLREAEQPEGVIQAHANHYSLVSQEKANTDNARSDIEDGLTNAGKQVGIGLSTARKSFADFIKKLDF